MADLDKGFEEIPVTAHALDEGFQEVPLDLSASYPTGSDLWKDLLKKLHVAEKGAEQGVTFGTAPKLAGLEQAGLSMAGVGGVQSVPQNMRELGIRPGMTPDEIGAQMKAAGFTGDVGPTSTSDIYEQAKNSQRNEYAQAQAESPGAYLTGNLAGGALTGGALAKAGVGIAGPGSNYLQRLRTAMKAGGAIGGGAEVAGHEYTGKDLGENLEQGAKAGATGAAIGALTGGALETGASALGALRNVMGDTELGSTFKTGEQMGMEGENIIRKSTAQKYTQEMQEEAGNLQKTLDDLTSSHGVKQEVLLRGLDKETGKISVLPEKRVTSQELLDLYNRGDISKDQYNNLVKMVAGTPPEMLPTEINSQVRRLRENLPSPQEFKSMGMQERAEVSFRKDFVDSLNDKLKNLDQVVENPSTQLQQLADQFKINRDKLASLLEVQGKDIGTPEYRLSGEKQPAPSLMGQIAHINKPFEPGAQQTYQNIKDVLKKTMPPEQTNALVSHLEDFAEKYRVGAETVARMKTGTPYQLSHTARASGVIGNLWGLTKGEFAPIINAVQGVKSTATPKLTQILKVIGNSPQEKRAALLYAVSQNEDYRNILGQVFGTEPTTSVPESPSNPVPATPTKGTP